MAEKPSLGDDTTLQEQSSAPGQVPSADNPTAAHHKTTAAADGPGPVVVHLGDAGVMAPGYRHPTVMPPVTIPQSIDEENEAMTANEAVTLMKEAVDSAIKHGDIDLAAVCVASPTSPLEDTGMQH